MRNFFCSAFLLLTILFCQTSFAQNVTNSGPDQLVQQYISTSTNNIDQIVRQNISNWMIQDNIPGVAVGIYYQGQNHFYNFGVANKSAQQPITKDTIFEIASLTKPFTATLLGICIQQGKCHLNDPVIKYLPALAKSNNAAISQVTLQDLATHTASFPRMVQRFGVKDDQSQNANDQLMQQLLQWQPKYPIGTHYSYSNIGFGLLGEAVANALGENYDIAIKQYILQPLDMSSTAAIVPVNQLNRYAQGYDAQGNPALHHVSTPWPGSASLRSTSSDLLQYLKANLGVIKIPTQLSAAINLTQQGYFKIKPNFMQGLAWQLKIKHNLNIINKTGTNAGFNSYVVMLPQQKIAIVVLTNKSGDRPGKIANRILQELAQNDNE